MRRTIFPLIVLLGTVIGLTIIDQGVYFLIADELVRPIPLIRGKEFEQTCSALAGGEETLGLACSPYFRDFPPVDYFQEGNRDPGSLFVYHPTYFWHLQPHASIDCFVPYVDGSLRELFKYSIRTNSRGFRGPEFANEKNDGVFRIVILGDSRTFGWGVEFEQAFPYKLQQNLGELLARPVEIINAGIPGYSSYQVLRLVEHEVCHWSPNLVICWFGCNDSWPCSVPDEELSQSSGGESFLRTFMSRSSLFLILRQLYFISVETNSRTWKSSLNTRRVPPSSFIRNCLLISKTFSSKDIPVIFISLGEGEQYHQSLQKSCNLSSSLLFDSETLFLDTQRKMRQGLVYQEEYAVLSNHLGLTILNRFPALDLFVDPAHPNSIGHDLLAQELAKSIREIQKSGESEKGGE